MSLDQDPLRAAISAVWTVSGVAAAVETTSGKMKMPGAPFTNLD